MSRFRFTIGIAIWVLLIGGFLVAVRLGNSGERAGLTASIGGYLATPRQFVEIQFEEPQVVRHGDPIFWNDGERFIRVGEIARVGDRDSTNMEELETNTAYAYFYARAPKLNRNDELAYHSTPKEIEWVVRMMLPPERRARIGELISDALAEHQKEIVRKFRPIIENALKEALPLIEADLRAALARREDRFRKIGDRYREDIVKKDILPLVENEIWPIVQDESAELVDELGQKIWRKASLFRFGWRVMYDSTPLPKRDLTKKEFERFVREDAVPIIQNHMDELIKLQEVILHKIANNQKVRRVVGTSILKISDDPEVRKIVSEIIDEVFVHNKRLLDLLERHWNGKEAQAAMALASEKLEPTVAAIGYELFGDPKKQITAEFSRVLRFKILKKDARWFILHPASLPSSSNDRVTQLKATPQRGDTLNPFHVPR